jgi:hypothetical protein
MRAFLVLAQDPIAHWTPNDFVRNNLQNTAAWVTAKTFISVLENHPQVIQFALESSSPTNTTDLDERWKNWNTMYARNQIWTVEIQTEAETSNDNIYTIYLSSDIYPVLKNKLQQTLVYEEKQQNGDNNLKAFKEQRYVLVKWNLLKMKSEEIKSFFRQLIEELRSL